MPLQVFKVLHAGEMSIAERFHLLRIRLTVGFRPGRPSPDNTVLCTKILLQRLEQRVLAQALAVLGLESAKSRARSVLWLR